MMIPETILFDFDGTLVDTKQDVWEALNYTRNQKGLPDMPADQIEKVLGPGREEFLARVYPDGSESEKENFLQQFQDYYFERCLNHTRFYPGMKEVLSQLPDNKRLAVASNKPRAFINKILKGLNAEDLFGCIVSPEDVTHTKPHPEMIFKAMDALNAEAGKTLLVGDTDKDVLAAKAAGVPVCWAEYGYGSVAHLEHAVPEFTIQQPEALLSILNG